MLTQEQIKNLKEGDPLIIHGTYEGKYSDGDLRITSVMMVGDRLEESIKTVHPSCVSLPSEHGTSVPTTKHAPTRLFKKGDRVRIKREIDGRKLNHIFVNFSYDQTYTVAQDEEQKEYQSGLVKIINETGHTFTGSFYELELVTPVEELEPYIMLENVPSNSIEVRDKRTNKVEATFYFGKDHAYTFEQAATRAEDERDRLNAEYRKEQK